MGLSALPRLAFVTLCSSCTNTAHEHRAQGASGTRDDPAADTQHPRARDHRPHRPAFLETGDRRVGEDLYTEDFAKIKVPLAGPIGTP